MTWNDRFRKVLPAAATFSKDPRCFIGEDTEPELFARHGYGARVYANGWYLDWICALGANILGYNNEEWKRALHEAVDQGTSYSLPTRLEVETAELLLDTIQSHVPGWQDRQLQVRFAKTGSECTEAAVRLARAVTGHDLILRCADSYLGWGSSLLCTTPPAWGIPKDFTKSVKLFEFNQDPATFIDDNFVIEKDGNLIEYSPSCVILEQGLTDPNPNWYPSLRQWCTDNGTLLILDETASGFRYGLGGAAERFGIQPDLVCYGKALGNGVAISALVGPKEYLEWFGRVSPVFVSGTFCGETLGLAGAKATLRFMRQNDVVGHLSKIGQALKDGLIDAFRDTPVKVIGHDVRSIIQWPSGEWHAYIVRQMLTKGILLNRPNFSTWAHTIKDVEQTVDVAKELVTNWKKNGLPEYKPEQLPFVLFKNR